MVSVDNQMKGGECGAIDAIINAMKIHKDSTNLWEWGCGAIGTILSSQKTYSKYCTPKVLDVVKECSKKHKESDHIKHFYLGLMREEDERVTDAVSRGVCTKNAFPKCKNDCGSDRNLYCPKCCVQQKAFRCYTCDKSEDNLYCEACWKKFHKWHKCEMFFCPARCATKTK